MASAPTNVNSGVLATGHTSNNLSGSHFGGLMGAVPIVLVAPTVAVSQTNLVTAQVAIPFKARYRAITYSGQASVATAAFDVIDSTQGASSTLIASTAAPNGAQGSSTTIGTASEILSKGDVIQLRATTNATGTITNLLVTLWVTPLGEADNPLPNASYNA